MTDIDTFRSHFPEFGTPPGTGAYSDPRVSFWLDVGGKLLNAGRWGDLLDHGLELFVAHHLSLEAGNFLAAAKGGAPGSTTGILTGKTVGPLSASYDAGVITLENAGHWNQTTYGIQFYQLMRMAGAGPVHVG